MMRKCAEWWTTLSAYADDSLPPDERECVEAHIEGCTDCQRTLLELQALRRSVQLLPHYEPPPMLKARILSATVDQPTWSEKLAMNWRRLVWRTSLAAAAATLVLLVWQLAPRQLPQAIGTLASDVAERGGTSTSRQDKKPQTHRVAPVHVAVLEKTPRVARRHPVSPPPKPSSPVRGVQWSTVARVPIAPEPAPADALQGEPLIEEDVPHIDVTSPPAGTDEQRDTSPDKGEGKTVATRFTIPAEVLNQGTSGLESLREQIRIRNQEQWSEQIKRKMQRKQVDVDVITVRF